jgi:hypothetical protein
MKIAPSEQIAGVHHVGSKVNSIRSGVPRNFVRGRDSTNSVEDEDIENGNLGAVGCRMYFPRKREFGSAL